MSNLIIVLISIALAAAVSLMSVSYMGNGMTSSHASANASKAVGYLSQISGAIEVWGQRNGGMMPRPNSSFPSACGNSAYCTIAELQSMLGARYVPQATAPDGTDAGQLYYWNESSSLMQNPVLLLRLTDTGGAGKAVCTAVEANRQGTTPAAIRLYGGGTVNINRYMCANYGCFQNDGTFGATGTYLYIVYARLRGAPNTSLADSAGPSCPTS